MELSIAVAHPCRAKEELGGTPALFDLYHKHLQSLAIRQEADRTHKDSGSFKIRIATLGKPGVQDVKTVSLAELERQAARIYEYAEDCAHCPASSNRQLCGCIGIVHLPIRQTAEQWLADRLPYTRGFVRDLFLQAIRDFQYDGAPLFALRQKHWLELPHAIAHDLPKNSFDLSEMSTDHIWHAILGVGPTFDPIHAALILLWLGLLQWDQKPIPTLELFGWITSLPAAERVARSSVNLGEPSQDASIRQIQNLLMMIYLAWSVDAPVSIQL